MGKLIEIGYKDIDIKEKLAKRILSADQTCCSTQKFLKMKTFYHLYHYKNTTEQLLMCLKSCQKLLVYFTNK